MNNISIMGRITKDLEIKKTKTDKDVLSFGIAVDRPYDKDITDFFDCVAWSKTAEFIQKYFSKGDKILITGELQTSEYKDKEGEKRKRVYICVTNVDFCGDTKKKSVDKKIEETDEEDIPF